jgi:hypothetical protein
MGILEVTGLWKESSVSKLAGKKIGAESGDPNLHSQPRLPGSVVGEESMVSRGKADKITKGTVRE